MKALVVYSSLTGNTKMVAEAVAQVLMPDCTLCAVEDNPNSADYDLVAVGYWVDRGTADKKAAAYLQTIKNADVALFVTIGADPQSEHARKSVENGIAMLDTSNRLRGTFICQGKIDPKLIENMSKMFPPGHPHSMTAERRARHVAASTHPDSDDLKAAQTVFGRIKVQLEDELRQI